ncbi:CHAT domain-containing protein [Sphingomonas endolithica]|uniref:CHAT domain-containing protein n=1 Tax=Sphingomonas endolithica TaxID=2972485 RepID=UPI0021AEDFCC|nr:CHAT domain-containing protein [Sphingomonas sp. ZFBP2030]
MIVRRRGTSFLLAGIATLAVPNGAVARLPDRPDTISLGRAAGGEPCVASREWRDPTVPDPFARAYTITCRGVSASRPLGSIRIVPATDVAIKPIDAALTCGTAQPVAIAAGPAQVRRCFNTLLSIPTVRIDLRIGESVLIGDATPAALAQLEEALAILSGRKRPSADVMRTVSTAVDLSKIAPEAVAAAPTTEAVRFSPAAALAEGINLNHKGLNVDASRVLNDALSRLPADANPATRAELLLEAGLADSNIRFPDAAQEHFLQADSVFMASPSAQTPFLTRKRDAYRALDLINRHQFREAIALLDRQGGSDVLAVQPLMDPSALRQLNQPRTRAGDAVSAIAVPDTGELAQLVLDAQANWARSIALLSLGDEKGATAAIELAARRYRPLENERIDRSQILWLGAKIDRQRARLLARGGRTGQALSAFDEALVDMRRGAVATAGTGAEPMIAQAQLERASIFAGSGASHAAVRDEYARAIDAMIDSNGDALAGSNGMEAYLDLLVEEASTTPRADTFARFFRAVQATGEPSVARQINQLQSVVAEDPALGALVRERADLEREVTRLRYAIAAGPEADIVRTSDDELQRARTTAEQRLFVVDAQLAQNPRYQTVDDHPATLEEVRAALKPGEVFLKIATLNRRVYGMVITGDRMFAYAIAPDAASKAAVGALAERVRASIDARLGDGKLVPFDDAGAYALFRLIAGPAEAVLNAAPGLVVDPSGPLEHLPIGVLVTRYDRNAVRPSPFDFSQTKFLAGQATISTALSPRSFLAARARPASRATRPFLGFGEHMPPPVVADLTGRMVKVGYSCSVDFGRLSSLSRAFQPISSRELTIAAQALGATGAPEIIGAAFNDTALDTRGDLNQYEVLHFATHGLEEGQWGCAMSPPALVTSFGDAASDGLLSFSEIAALNLDANLVVLSACDTASGVRDEALARQSGQEEAGSTLEGLVRAFLTANARSVLATYWQVSAEHESEEFMRVFYESGRTKPIGAALQDAQRDLIAQPDYSHPFYWAPYFLVGDSSKTMLSPRTPAPAIAASR